MTAAGRAVVWAVLVAAVVVIPRTVLISAAHSEYWDDQYHLVRGLAAWTRTELRAPYNDPPLGEAIEALPLFVMGVRPHSAEAFGGNRQVQLSNVLYGQVTRWGGDVSPETLLMVVAVWKAALFLPLAGVLFAWVRDVYGARAGWLALGLLLVEPTIAAHIGTGALDVLGMEFVVFAVFATCRYLRRPGVRRLAIASALCAAAMLVKHTGLITPLVCAAVVLVDPLRPGTAWGARWRAVGLAAVMTVAFLWPLTLFDVSRPGAYVRPPIGWAEMPPSPATRALAEDDGGLWRRIATVPMPAGVYLGSLLEAREHAAVGHHAFLFGETREEGFWYYYPVVAAYKVPLGVAGVIVLAVVSLAWRRFGREELVFVIPAAAWAVFVMLSNINIGFRHALPAYVFVLLWSARVAREKTGSGEETGSDTVSRFAKMTPVPFFAWAGVGLTFAHSLVFHPDYLSYINWPRYKAYWDVSDSNVDWGQSREQIDAWLRANPTNRPVAIRPFTDPQSVAWLLTFGGRGNVRMLTKYDPPPTSGLLILSMVREPDPYDPNSPYKALRPHVPDAVIGQSTLVYDLDRLGGGQAFDWGRRGG